MLPLASAQIASAAAFNLTSSYTTMTTVITERMIAQKKTDSIKEFILDANLNFSCFETPFKMYLNISKTFILDHSQRIQNPSDPKSSVLSASGEVESKDTEIILKEKDLHIQNQRREMEIKNKKIGQLENSIKALKILQNNEYKKHSSPEQKIG